MITYTERYKQGLQLVIKRNKQTNLQTTVSKYRRIIITILHANSLFARLNQADKFFVVACFMLAFFGGLIILDIFIK